MNEAEPPFRDRRHAGGVLAQKLGHYSSQANVRVLALPRGGVPVGFEVARALQLPLEIFVVRKLGFPGHQEYAIGAIASGGVQVMTALPGIAVSPEAIAEVIAREQVELRRREELYRSSQHPTRPLQGCTVIVVDDGLATGASLRAAVRAIRQQRPVRLVVAVPVGAEAGWKALREEVDELVCAVMPQSFCSASQWYQNFPQTSDDEVRALLEEARQAASLLCGGNPASAT